MRWLRALPWLLILALAGCAARSTPALTPAPGSSPASPSAAPLKQTATLSAPPTGTSAAVPQPTLSPGPTPTPLSGTVAISQVLASDLDHGRLYASGTVDGESRTLLLSAADGTALGAWDTVGPLAIDAEHRRCFVEDASGSLLILDADSGQRIRTVDLPAPVGEHRLVAPVADPARQRVMAFRGNVGYWVDSATGAVLGSHSFDLVKTPDCRVGDGPEAVAWAAYDPSDQVLYISYLSYVCTPWYGHTIISYNVDTWQELGRSGAYPFHAVAAGGYLYASSWHRFGVGYLWAWLHGQQVWLSSDWSSQPLFTVDQTRGRLYGRIAGSLGVFDAATMDLLYVADWPVAGFWPDDTALLDHLEALVKTPVAAPELIRVVPAATAVDGLWAVSGPEGKVTLFGLWGNDQPPDECYAFAQTGGRLLTSRDDGQTWLSMGVGLPACAYVSALAVSPGFASDHTVWAGVVGTGVFRSTDAGATWRPASTGLESMGVRRLLAMNAGAGPVSLLAYVATGGPFVSSAGAGPWRPLVSTTFTSYQDVVVSPSWAADNTGFAVATVGPLQRTLDGGSTWVALTVDADLVALSPEFAVDHTLLAQTRDHSRLLISRDGGQSWQSQGAPLAGGRVLWLSLAPLFDKWGVAFARVEGSPALFRSADAGRTWHEAVLSSGEHLMLPAEATIDLTYASAPEEARPLYLLVTWTEWAEAGSVKHGTLYRSGNGGLDWHLVTLPEGRSARSLALSPEKSTAPVLYIGTADGLVLRLTDAEVAALGN
ncbi:MAG TPA: hypothetical protein PKW05_05845 [Anaerolineae bacterium]|nr:hypothetical protein [Anaerolineae bacterium]HQJ51284.1 hypothetical protein [Anaerolineae bacterium]